MEKKFDYAKAIAELEEIAAKVENPETKLDDIDALIEKHAIGWPVSRIALVDLTILRLALWEILYEDDVPGNVAISEALQLTEQYSDPEDKGFVNGILGTVLREKEKQE